MIASPLKQAKPPAEQLDVLRQSIQTRQQRRETWVREGERSIGQNLAMVGMIGWLIVTPIVAGMFLGIWLDRIFDSGIFWTGALLVLGTVFGCVLAWKRMSQERS